MTKRTPPEEMAIDEDGTSTISFVVARRFVIVVGRYRSTATDERLGAWQAVHEFGIEMMSELLDNYGGKLGRVAQYEVVPGEVVFDIESNVTLVNRRHAVEAVQRRFHAERLTDVVGLPQ